MRPKVHPIDLSHIHKDLPGTKVLLQQVGDEEWWILDVYRVTRHLLRTGRLALHQASQLRYEMGEELRTKICHVLSCLVKSSRFVQLHVVTSWRDYKSWDSPIIIIIIIIINNNRDPLAAWCTSAVHGSNS